MFKNLNARERRLLIAMFSVVGCFASFILYNTLTGTLDELESQIADHQRALARLTQSQGFQDQLQERGDLYTLLRDNDLQLPSFIEQMCDDTSVDRPMRYEEDERELLLQGDGNETLVELETKVTIQAVDPVNFNRLLNAIASSPELVIIKYILIQPSRTQAESWQVDITLTTYRLEESTS